MPQSEPPQPRNRKNPVPRSRKANFPECFQRPGSAQEHRPAGEPPYADHHPNRQLPFPTKTEKMEEIRHSHPSSPGTFNGLAKLARWATGAAQEGQDSRMRRDSVRIASRILRARFESRPFVRRRVLGSGSEDMALPQCASAVRRDLRGRYRTRAGAVRRKSENLCRLQSINQPPRISV